MDLDWWYFAAKLAAYTFWMWVGLRWFPAGEWPIVIRALLLGTLRLLMGLGFGLVIWIVGSAVFQVAGSIAADNREMVSSIVTYLLVYVPVRWIEWSIFDLIVVGQRQSFRDFMFGSSSMHRKWRGGGIAISCLADIPVMISLGGVLPVGRFMC
jgi:hypothetical protein